MKIPTYEEFLQNNKLDRKDLRSEIFYKELLERIIRVALENMMLNVHHKQKECSIEQMYSLASMFHTMNNFFVIPQQLGDKAE